MLARITLPKSLSAVPLGLMIIGGMFLSVCLASGQEVQPQDSVATPKKPAAATPDRDRRGVDIRVDKTLVLINVTVTDPLNRFVTGLEKEHFKLFEDKVEQEITQFSSEDAPISIGLVFDTSGSMGPKLQKSRQAASEFFNDRPELVVPFTTDTDKIQSTLTFTQSKGRTALLDSVYLAMHEMKKAKNPRKAVLIISDGGDNSSRYTETEIKNAVREADVQIFAIGIFESAGNRGRTPEEASGPGLLNIFLDIHRRMANGMGNIVTFKLS